VNRNTILILAAITIAIVLPIASVAVVAAQPQIIKVQDSYSCSLAAYGQSGDGCISELYSNVLALDPYLSNTSPSGATICVGYWSTSLSGPCTYVTGSGLGSTAGSGSWYCFWGNTEFYSVSIKGTCTAYYN
jgi:hypothetical protein